MSESNTKPRVPAEELKATTAEILGRYVESANAHGASLITMKLQLRSIAAVIYNVARDLNQDKVDELVGKPAIIIKH